MEVMSLFFCDCLVITKLFVIMGSHCFVFRNGHSVSRARSGKSKFSYHKLGDIYIDLGFNSPTTLLGTLKMVECKTRSYQLRLCMVGS